MSTANHDKPADDQQRQLEPQLLLWAYCNGIFPMANDDGHIEWYSPDPRAIIDLDSFSPPKNLRRVIRRGRFSVSIDRAFGDVIRCCATRQPTWISQQIIDAYEKLHRIGRAHSIECWAGTELAGGLYGVSIGGAFFGESMFHRYTDASKVALAALVVRMRQCRMVLLDVQYLTEHLQRLWARQIPRAEYLQRLKRAVAMDCELATGAQWLKL